MHVLGPFFWSCALHLEHSDTPSPSSAPHCEQYLSVIMTPSFFVLQGIEKPAGCRAAGTVVKNRLSLAAFFSASIKMAVLYD
jgi:hypothetical protein